MVNEASVERSVLTAWFLFLLICRVTFHPVAGQVEGQGYLLGTAAVSSRAAAPRQLWPIRNITCCYDVDTGFITGIRYSRFSSQGDMLTSRTGRCSINSTLTSSITLPSTADNYITGVNATYTDMSLLSLQFLLSNNRQRTCVVSKASFDPAARARRIQQRRQAVAGLSIASVAAADVDQDIRRAASHIGLAQTMGIYNGPLTGYSKDKPTSLFVKQRLYEGPLLYGKKAGLSSLQGICDPRTRHLKNFEPDDDDKHAYKHKPNKCFHWVPCPEKCCYWPDCIPCVPGALDPKCCCYASQPVPNPFSPSPGTISRPVPPKPSPINRWPSNPWPDPIDQNTSPSPPGRSPRPSPPPGGSPPPRPPRPSPSPKPPAKSPRPPRPPHSPDPGESPDPQDNPTPSLPVPFTIGFAARGQHGCINPVTQLFTARLYQYAFEKLSAAGFGSDYSLKYNNCTCVLDATQWNTPIYNCNLELSIADPTIGDPEIIAEYVAGDIDASGPWACIDEYQSWCAQPDEYPTSACAAYPANSTYLCTIDEPPDPLPIPIVFVDEGRNCNPTVQFTQDQQKALVDFTFRFTTGLGLVLTYENFTCGSELGNAYYQATLLLAAGVDVDIYTGSDNIVTGINAQATVCQKTPQPAYCQIAPLSNALMCTVNQYDPKKPYICPAAPGNVAVTVAAPNCSCTSAPDSATYQRNLAVWMNDITSQNAVNAAISVPEGTCVQSGTNCQYQYRVRAQPLDEFQDSLSAIQTIATDLKNNPQPCWPADSAIGWPFCSYWTQATACARVPWNRDQPLVCDILPTN